MLTYLLGEELFLDSFAHFKSCIICWNLRVLYIAQMVKNLHAMQETQVRSLDWEDPPEKGMQHSPTPIFLPGEFHGQRSLVGYRPWGHKELDTTQWLTLSLYSLYRNPLSDVWFGNTLSFSVHPPEDVFQRTKPFNVDEVQFINFFLLRIITICIISKHPLTNVLFSKSFLNLCFFFS